MLSSDEENSKNSLDTLRSSIFESRSANKPGKKRLDASALTPSKHHSLPKDYHDSFLAKENMSEVMNFSKTAVESELLGARLTEEIRRLRNELSFSTHQAREATQQLQSCQQDNAFLRANTNELQLTIDNLQRDRQLDEGEKNSKLNAYASENERVLAENNSLRDEVASLRRKLTAADEMGLRLARSLEVSHHEAEDARKQEHFSQEGYLQNFLSALKQKDVDINALTRTVQELRVENSTLMTEAQHRKSMDQELQNLKRQYEALDRSKQESGSARVYDLERQVKALTDQRTFLNREKADLEDQCLELRKENSKFESRIFDLRQKHQSQSQSQSDIHSQHASEVESYANKNRELSFQLNASRKTIDELTAISGSQDSVVHKLRVELSVLQDKYATLKRLNMQLLSATSTYENILQFSEKR
mmetsp:Transcript_8429/g.14305  ORF Transcript_8429/g.14305 Transcript_8429/m.14305 type:complete len:420 (+) Transcript_8429:121-1380(+)|eukprot:CAMPEP_0114425626 /NCGR_PEP_ID=MMETSP0103-20121206/7341_1 /TAXON_ID=37642 ORGANISM="Paraphysomonas imperforata, Strain PA2" /NCGR_SAMPLE_ID=MMETSP0103 /ASSEMBLY_ACC=CAM_ASM_000201 /LENGTH=419 /DNA_ID=CAMNT_0001594485 /DNA_START=98 /DNA_END=1357 /DNA_ORIENTATION=-